EKTGNSRDRGPDRGMGFCPRRFALNNPGRSTSQPYSAKANVSRLTVQRKRPPLGLAALRDSNSSASHPKSDLAVYKGTKRSPVISEIDSNRGFPELTALAGNSIDFAVICERNGALPFLKFWAS